MIKCPRCGSKNIATERRPDGNHVCSECHWRWPNRKFFTSKCLEGLKREIDLNMIDILLDKFDGGEQFAEGNKMMQILRLARRSLMTELSDFELDQRVQILSDQAAHEAFPEDVELAQAFDSGYEAGYYAALGRALPVPK